MTSIINRALVVSVLVLGASACSNNDNGTGTTGNTTTPAPPVVVAPRQEDQFGVAFGTAFRAASDGEPFTVQDGDLTAISLTTEPVTIN